jgi:hypothetical protein
MQAWLPVYGKRPGHWELNALGGGGMIFLKDDESKQQFLVDTGAAFSVFPHRSGPPLSGADEKEIPC